MSELADHFAAEIHESIAVKAELGPQAARAVGAWLQAVQGLVAFGNGAGAAAEQHVALIGSDSGEIPNVIGDAGMVFRERDCDQLLHCLKLCCENERVRTTLVARGLERVLANFTNQRIAERTLEIYGRVTGSNNGRDRALRSMSASSMSGV